MNPPTPERQEYISANNARLWCSIAGTGDPVVLLPSGGSDLRIWDDQVDTLSAEFRVIRYDPRGFGQSEPSHARFSHAGDLAALLDALGVESASVVGSSRGGGIALEKALKHPARVHSLILAGPVLPLSSVGEERFSATHPNSYRRFWRRQLLWL